MLTANQGYSRNLYHAGAVMRDNRYYYGTGPDGNRRGIRKDPAYRAEMARRDVLRLRAMIAEIDHTIMALERSIEAELELAGVDDRRNLAYPTSARAMEARLENLRITRGALVGRLPVQPSAPLETTA
jgi:hypothetical protein